MQRKTIVLPDGFNGATARFYADPIAIDGALVKLRCALPGKEYLTRWARREDLAGGAFLRPTLSDSLHD